MSRSRPPRLQEAGKSSTASVLPEPKVLRDHRSREVVIFTTPSGVTGIFDTSISLKGLDAMARSLRRSLRRRGVKRYPPIPEATTPRRQVRRCSGRSSTGPDAREDVHR